MRKPNNVVLDVTYQNVISPNQTSYWINNLRGHAKQTYTLSKYSVCVSNNHTTTFKDSRVRTSNLWANHINCNFLRKERIYTKLKYSRSPAYDIVSGGAAALLAGFIGFLISEKFGYELVDSGDFYYLFMYFVFLSFSLRPLLMVANSRTPLTSTLSPLPIVRFFMQLIKLLLIRLR